MTTTIVQPEPHPATSWQERFERDLPIIRGHAINRFRGLDPQSREDLIEEVIANACCAYERQAEKELPAGAVAKFAVRQVREGRRVGKSVSINDVFDETARNCGRVTIQHLGTQSSDPHAGSWREALQDNRQTPVPDQVAFRMDFPRWLDSQSDRDRRMAVDFMDGDRPGTIADRYGVSRGRVSQVRRELADSWDEYCGDDGDE